MKQVMSKGQFSSKLAVFHGQAKKVGPMLQELLEDGILYAMHPKDGGDGNLRRLTLVIHACQMVKSVPTRTIQRYIQAHVDCKWQKLDDDTMGFKFVGGANGTLPEVSWTDWSGNQEKDAKPALDIEKRLKSMLSQAEKDAKEGKEVKHAEYVPEIKALLKRMTAQVHTEEKPVAVEGH